MTFIAFLRFLNAILLSPMLGRGQFEDKNGLLPDMITYFKTITSCCLEGEGSNNILKSKTTRGDLDSL